VHIDLSWLNHQTIRFACTLRIHVCICIVVTSGIAPMPNLMLNRNITLGSTLRLDHIRFSSWHTFATEFFRCH
jgi:hypothetical protein